MTYPHRQEREWSSTGDGVDPRIEVNIELERSVGLASVVFFEEARRHAHGFSVRELAVAETDLDWLADLGAELAHWRSGSGADVRVFEMHHATCSVQLRGDSARSMDAARTDDEADVALEAITACLTHAEPTDDEMPVAFWSANGMGGGGCEVRTVAAPGWEDIRATQASAPRAALDRLMRVERPPGGRLVLWHGEPGTGKTFALRALVRAWRPWCASHFITDPEDLLSGGSAYLLGCVLGVSHSGAGGHIGSLSEAVSICLSVDITSSRVDDRAVDLTGLTVSAAPIFRVLRSFSWKSSQRWVDCQSAAAEVDEGDEGLG